MKTKNKMMALVEIAVVLCSVFLVVSPVIAADQNQETQKVSANTVTTTSEDDYVLGVYGNANEDDTIDMRDLTYVKLIFFGKKPETELADAKYDGEINPLDFIQIKLIIVGKEKKITFKDAAGEVITVNKPVKRIVALMTDSVETLRAINAEDKIVGTSSWIVDEVFFPEINKLPRVGSLFSPDFEAILSLNPNVFMPFTASVYEEQKKKLPGITFVYLGLRFMEGYPENVRKLGYILDNEEEAEEFASWYEGWINKIKSRTEGLTEDEKPRVFFWSFYKPGGDYQTVAKTSRIHQICEIAGGEDVAEDLPFTSIWPKVDAEWVIKQNPDVIVALTPCKLSLYGYNVNDPSEMKAMWEEIMNRPELANVNAVKNGNVYMVSLRLWCKPSGGGCLVGIPYMAKWFQPELFEDIEPKATHQEYLTRFQGLDIDLDKKGVFVYHPDEHPDGK